jgi:hypothetical protein
MIYSGRVGVVNTAGALAGARSTLAAVVAGIAARAGEIIQYDELQKECEDRTSSSEHRSRPLLLVSWMRSC